MTERCGVLHRLVLLPLLSALRFKTSIDGAGFFLQTVELFRSHIIKRSNILSLLCEMINALKQISEMINTLRFMSTTIYNLKKYERYESWEEKNGNVQETPSPRHYRHVQYYIH